MSARFHILGPRLPACCLLLIRREKTRSTSLGSRKGACGRRSPGLISLPWTPHQLRFLAFLRLTGSEMSMPSMGELATVLPSSLSARLRLRRNPPSPDPRGPQRAPGKHTPTGAGGVFCPPDPDSPNPLPSRNEFYPPTIVHIVSRLSLVFTLRFSPPLARPPRFCFRAW